MNLHDTLERITVAHHMNRREEIKLQKEEAMVDEEKEWCVWEGLVCVVVGLWECVWIWVINIAMLDLTHRQNDK